MALALNNFETPLKTVNHWKLSMSWRINFAKSQSPPPVNDDEKKGEIIADRITTKDHDPDPE